MKTLKLNFTNSRGAELAARLELPVGTEPVAYALFAHCFTCGKNLAAIHSISRALTQQGIAVLRFDFTGIGESEGEFADTDFSSQADDLLGAALFLEQNYKAPQILIGHSLGGAAAIIAAAQLPSVRALVSIAAPADAAHVQRLMHDSIEHIRTTGKAKVSLGGRMFTITQQFLDDIDQSRVCDTLAGLECALLLMHSPQDTVVGINNARELYDVARHPKSFISLDGADHLLMRREDALYVGTVIAAWASRYVSASTADSQAEPGQVVTRTGETHYTTEIRAGVHTLFADEPIAAGGNDLGPTPYDLLAAALGACTGMTLRMYADSKQWPLNEVKVLLTHRKDYVEDCAHSEKAGTKIDVIDRVIALDGELSDEQKTRLLQIADKCPVHKTLHSEIRINTTLKEQP